MKILKALLFMVIWVAGCALQDFVFKIEAGAYLMLYGVAVASIAWTLPKIITPSDERHTS